MIQPKPEITNTPPAYHGAFDYDELRQLGYSPDEVIDFSVNSNPYGPPPGVREAIARVPLDRYPDRECIALREELATHLRHRVVRTENLVVGNGVAELLMLIAQAFIRTGDNVLVIGTTFGEYERSARLAGAVVHTHSPSIHGDVQYGQIASEIVAYAPRLLFLCHPNNPTGVASDPQRLGDLADTFPNTLFVVDEAYINFAPETLSVYDHSRDYRNLLVVRSLTKDYALAGLRLGYALGAPDMIRAVAALRPAWNVNGLAQAAGLAVLSQDSWLRETVHQLHDNKRQLVNGLRSLGLEPLPSSVHYFLLNVGDGAAFRSKLLRHKIMVRDCASFGLPEYVRIATRTPEDNAKLLAAVEMIRA
jgi:histidinol-phosphate aminotransferase